MTYIQWLLEKLVEEISFAGPDVIAILFACRNVARTSEMRNRVELAIELWTVFPADTSGDYIVLMLTQMTNSMFDRKYSNHLEFLRVRVLMDWFIDFCISKNAI